MGKAVIFSIVSLLIVILFVSSSSLISKFKISETEIEVTRTRVRILNSVVSDLENNYFDKLLYLSSKNSLVGISRYYASTDFDGRNMKKNLDLAVNDIIYQGILDDNKGVYQDNLTKLGYMDYNYTVKGLINNITLVLDRLGLKVNELNITVSPIDGIRQVDPWTVQVKGEFTYFISDKKGIASWKGFSTKIVNVSVIGITAYDREDGFNMVSNEGIITSDWKLDNGTRTEDTVLSKLGQMPRGTQPRGICRDYCENN